MFKNDYQGGSFFEIFSAQGKDPTGIWKLQGGSGIRKVYEKEVKSYIYSLEGTVATTRMQLPKDPKQSLSLVQHYLVLQINVPKGGEFSLEIGVSDIGNNKRRINMSTSVREVSVTPLHAKLPLTVLRKSVWVNACVDMVRLVGDTWGGQTYGKIDSLSISANCKLRRILTMKHQLHDSTDDHVLYGVEDASDMMCDSLPRQHQLASDVTHYNQVINMQKIRAVDPKLRTERPPSLDLDLNASGRRNFGSEGFHIAFGTKVGKPPTAVARKSTSIDLPSHRDGGRSAAKDINDRGLGFAQSPTHKHSTNSDSSRQRLLSDPGVLYNPHPHTCRSNSLNQSRSWSGAEIQEQRMLEASSMKPHPPPRDSSSEPVHRRKPKVRSGDRHQRTPADAHLKPAGKTQPGVKSVRCPHCSYTCYTRQRLKAHLTKHDESRKFICALCNMAFKSKQALRMHTMYHTGDAGYVCDVCNFRTVTELRLKKHKLRHTDERNYSCNLCGKKFKQPHHVTQHRDIVHLGKPSYRERKRIALQQNAAEALGSLNSADFGQTLVVNDDGTTTALVDLHAVSEAQRSDEPTQYVMVETPAGYQYVAVVIPDADTQASTNTVTTNFVTDGTQVSADANTLEDAQILLSQATDQTQTIGVYYTPAVSAVGAENSHAVESIVALQPQ